MVDDLRSYEDIREKVEPLRKLSGAKTAKMGAETSDAMLKVLVSSLKKEGRLKELDEILWGERRFIRHSGKLDETYLKQKAAELDLTRMLEEQVKQARGE